MTPSEILLYQLETAYFTDHSRNDALQSIVWYVSTGRASPAWIRAARKANPAKLLDNIRGGTIDEQIDRATAYLRHYCKLSA